MTTDLDIAAPIAEAGAARRFHLSILALVAALALAALDNNIVNTALPRMAAGLGGLDRLSWVVSAFMLSCTITMPLYGKLSDIYGRRALFTVAIGIFVLASILCSLSANMDQLIAFRTLQGAGAGGLVPLVMTAIGDIVPVRERGKYQGLFAAVFAVCNLGGPVLGGLLTDAFGWRSIFYVNVPVGAAALVLLRANLPPSQRQSHAVDYVGAILVALATVPLMIGLSRVVGPSARSASTVMLFGGAALAGLTLYLWEKRVAEPVVAVNLFGDSTYWRCIVVITLIGLGFFGTIVFIPLYLQQARQVSPAVSGMMIVPLLIGNIISSLLVGRYVSRTGRYKPALAAGMGIVAIGLLLLSVLLSANADLWALGATLAVIGVGGGLGMPQLTLAAQHVVSQRDLGAATSTLQFFNALAGSAGVALSGALLSFGVGAAGAAKTGPAAVAAQALITRTYGAAIGRACLLSAIICGGAFLASLFIPDVRLDES